MDFKVTIEGEGVSRLGVCLRGASYNLGTDSLGWGFGGSLSLLLLLLLLQVVVLLICGFIVGTSKKSHNGVFTDYGAGYRKGDTIGCALDLATGWLQFS